MSLNELDEHVSLKGPAKSESLSASGDFVADGFHTQALSNCDQVNVSRIVEPFSKMNISQVKMQLTTVTLNTTQVMEKVPNAVGDDPELFISHLATSLSHIIGQCDCVHVNLDKYSHLLGQVQREAVSSALTEVRALVEPLQREASAVVQRLEDERNLVSTAAFLVVDADRLKQEAERLNALPDLPKLRTAVQQLHQSATF